MPHATYIRVDERLIHGQILQKWLSKTGCKKIFIIDEEVSKDVIMQSVLSLTLPEKVQAEFFDVQTGAIQIQHVKEDLFLLLKDLETAWKLLEHGVYMKSINICRLPYMSGKKKIFQNIFISSEEEEILYKMLSKKIDVYVQMVPYNDVIQIADLLHVEASDEK